MDKIINEPVKTTILAKYLAIIREYESKSEVQKWEKRCRKIIKRYKDQRDAGDENASKFNVLWSNIETLKPSLYAQTPNPEVSPKHKQKDDVALAASSVLEKSIQYFLATNYFGSTMRQAVFDYLTTARGVVWARYVPHMREMQVSTAQEEGGQITDDAELPQEVYYEEVFPDYVHWCDFGHNVARTWEEVTCVWRKAYLTRSQLIKRFGEEIGKAVPLDYTVNPGEQESAKTSPNDKATVYELWDRDTKQVVWLTKNHDKELDVKEDPLKLEKFFPCPKPVYCNLTNDSLIPTPDYAEYQDQAEELDSLTGRITALTKAVKVAGVCAGNESGLQRLLSEGTENMLIPVDSWMAFADKGGLKGVYELMPMQEIAQTLLTLYDARERVKQDLYEISGLGDIIRGSTNPNETATAQNIKSSYITLRLSDRQKEIQRFARNVIEIMGQIIARHFGINTLRDISGVQLFTEAEKQQVMMMVQGAPGQPPAPPNLPPEIERKMRSPTWEQVDALFKSDDQFCFSIDIETDSTMAANDQQDKQDRMEFLQAVSGFLEKIVVVPPEIMPLACELMMFGVRSFRVGRDLEGSFEEAMSAIQSKAKQAAAAPPQPSPEQIKAQADQAKQQQDAQLQQMQMQADAQKAQQEAQLKMALQQSQQQADERLAAMQVQADARAQQQEQAFEAWKVELEDRTTRLVAEMQANLEQQRMQVQEKQHQDQMAQAAYESSVSNESGES